MTTLNELFLVVVICCSRVVVFFCGPQKQSIQAQVASESAHELDEIQRAIAAESQSSRGSASIGNGGASVVGGAAAQVQGSNTFLSSVVAVGFNGYSALLLPILARMEWVGRRVAETPV